VSAKTEAFKDVVKLMEDEERKWLLKYRQWKKTQQETKQWKNNNNIEASIKRITRKAHFKHY